jgi:hypothetical protein
MTFYTSSTNAIISSPLCSSGGTAISINGLTLSLDIMAETTFAPSDVVWLPYDQGGAVNQGFFSGSSTTMIPGVWYTLTATLSGLFGGPLNADTIGLEFIFSPTNVYITNIQLK